MIKDLIEEKDTNISARNELVLHYSYLVDNVINKYFKMASLEADDVRSIGIEALIRAIDSYKITGENPHQYFIRHCNDNIFYAVSHALEAHESRIKHYGSRFEDTMLVEYGNFEEIIDKIAFSELSVKYIEELSSYDKSILKLYFGIGTKRCTDKEIAEMFGISRCVISKRRAKIINALCKRLMQDNISLEEKRFQLQKNVDF